MTNSYRRVTLPVLLASLVALAACDVAVSQQHGGPNLNGSTPEPLTPAPLPEPDTEEKATFMENLLG